MAPASWRHIESPADYLQLPKARNCSTAARTCAVRTWISMQVAARPAMLGKTCRAVVGECVSRWAEAMEVHSRFDHLGIKDRP